jgi:hypothetical protein
VENIAKSSRLSEGEVARKAVELAQDGAARNADDGRAVHVGFYLIDKGLPLLERSAEVHVSAFEALQKVACRFPLLLYVGMILLITVILAGSLLAKAYAGGLHRWKLGLVGILSLLCVILV